MHMINNNSKSNNKSIKLINMLIFLAWTFLKKVIIIKIKAK